MRSTEILIFLSGAMFILAFVYYCERVNRERNGLKPLSLCRPRVGFVFLVGKNDSVK